jgi:hypothetical protein
MSAYGKTYCPRCRTVLDVRRLRCPECGHERQPDPEPEEKTDDAPKGWAAVYAPRRPANQIERMAAQLRQYAEGNFSGTTPWRTPGLSGFWKRGGWH